MRERKVRSVRQNRQAAVCDFSLRGKPGTISHFITRFWDRLFL
ncbi:hypothetical protein HOLDEFILI_02875 [Holdemania filiformis DSM 12042]|uniref:Uncharacterized protein n=1 Tax=Holdemania filiformis DSM 12042 TaxID=545696 RepID=B9YAL8_9FIRM|nr:hypothetical protein HOLDEFILI_02875 [Holdemania filiformis DSM 12042]